MRDGIAAGTPVQGLILVEALWARMCAATREDGSTIAPNDPDWDTLVAAATAARDRPEAWLEQRRLYGDLAGHEPFRRGFSLWLRKIWADGAMAALDDYLQG